MFSKVMSFGDKDEWSCGKEKYLISNFEIKEKYKNQKRK